MQKKASPSDELAAKIRTRQARVGVVGLGVVGLSQALAFARGGFRVIGVDTDSDHVASLAERGSGAQPPSGEAEGNADIRLHRVTTNFEDLRDAECVIISVPTSSTSEGMPDLTTLTDAAREVALRLTPGMLVVVESTVPPRTTREVVLPVLASSGLRLGEDFFLAFSPERVDPGNAVYPVEAIPKLVGGMTPACTELAVRLYEQVVAEVHEVSSPEIAELAKVFENTFRYVNIGLVNELALLCSAMELSVHEVIDACATKPFAFMAHRPGPGVGGRCIPIAPRFLAWAAREVERQLPVTEAAIRLNEAMPSSVMKRARALLCEGGTSQDGQSVLLLGMAYKPNLDDTRGSVAMAVAAQFLRTGTRVLYHDPHVPSISIDGQQLSSQELEPGLLANVDCVVLLCPHENVDYDLVLRHAKLLLDPTGRLPVDGQRVFSL